MKIAIISGGNIQETFASGFLSEYKPDMLIAADRGLDFCLESGFLPDLAVGDFDSLQSRDVIAASICAEEENGSGNKLESDAAAPFCDSTVEYGGNSGFRPDEQQCIVKGKTIRIIRHRPEKDATDTELAVSLAAESGASEICMLGATGTRLDHVWGNLSLLYRLRERRIRGWIIDQNNRISMPAENEIILRRKEQFGKYVSIMPYGGPVTGLTLTGFHYPLTEFTLEPGRESLCVSNEIDEETAVIRWKTGVPVIIESRD